MSGRWRSARGYVRTGLHERVGVDAGPLWRHAARVVEECLDDLSKGKVVSVPSCQCKVIVAVADVLPRPLVRRLMALGDRDQT